MSELIEELRRALGLEVKLEKFHDYLARQMGFKHGNECPKLCKLAYEYLKWEEGIDVKMYDYFASEGEYAESLFVKLVHEFERCILAFFCFGWHRANLLISQVLSVDSEPKVLRNFVMTAARKQRFENITKDLKVTSMFSTPIRSVRIGEQGVAEVVAPIAHSERSPVLLLVGGGMGTGKSTVLKHILNESFWKGAAANAVMVEADLIDREQIDDAVNRSSKELLVRALNEGRDVIMNGTLSWGSFVIQTIVMAKNVHEHRYRVGEGFKMDTNGITSETYWSKVAEDEKREDSKIRKPYRIEFVGVVCEPYIAVIRNIRRTIQMGKKVNIKSNVKVSSQLEFHKKFAILFGYYTTYVDIARLYNTDVIDQPPKLIAWKGENSKLLFDPKEIKPFKLIRNLNEEATSIFEVYGESDQVLQPGSIWNDTALASEGFSNRQELHTAIKKIEESEL